MTYGIKTFQRRTPSSTKIYTAYVGDKQWLKHSVEDRPSMILKRAVFLSDGITHCATELSYFWHQDGKMHRETGPAYLLFFISHISGRSKRDCLWYLWGKEQDPLFVHELHTQTLRGKREHFLGVWDARGGSW